MSNSERWPVSARTGQPLSPRAQPGYYPGYETLTQQSFWDAATRAVVLKRVNEPPEIQFFTEDEARLLHAVCDRILPQDDRDEAHKIPIINGIDHRLQTNQLDGYRYESMPRDQEAHRLGLKAIEQIAQYMFHQPFIKMGPLDQDCILKSIHGGQPPAAQEIWDRMPIHRYWMLLVQDVVEQYYAHPYAWDEIGFGGPAYPRGYMRLENGEPEPWEVEEERYEWEAPPQSLSGMNELIVGTDAHTGESGEGGTH